MFMIVEALISRCISRKVSARQVFTDEGHTARHHTNQTREFHFRCNPAEGHHDASMVPTSISITYIGPR